MRQQNNGGPDYYGFTRAIMEEWQEHYDIEASDKFDLAVKFGLLVEIPGGFDPDKHEDAYGDAEKGDKWYQSAMLEAQGAEGNGHDLPTCRACGYPGSDDHEDCPNCAEVPA